MFSPRLPGSLTSSTVQNSIAPRFVWPHAIVRREPGTGRGLNMPTCSCPHCGRTGIPFELAQSYTEFECAKCGGRFTPMGGAVPSAREPLPPPIRRLRKESDRVVPHDENGRGEESARPAFDWRWFSGIGAMILLLGLFSPVVQGPFGTSRNYFNQPTFADHPLSLVNGVCVIILLIIAVVATMTRSPRTVGIVSILIALMLALAFLYFEATAPDIVHLSWGWALLLIGTGLIFAGGVFGAFPPSSRY